jgi:hypothetical protein
LPVGWACDGGVSLCADLAARRDGQLQASHGEYQP